MREYRICVVRGRRWRPPLLAWGTRERPMGVMTADLPHRHAYGLRDDNFSGENLASRKPFRRCSTDGGVSR